MAAWLRTIILGFLTVVFVAIFALLVWATASSITAAIAAPILDLLVGRVDEVTFGAPRAVSLSWVSDAAFNIGQALLTLCLVLPLNVAAFAVAWIPPIGPFAGLFLVSTAAGFAALDIAAARRRFTLGQKIRVATTNFPAILGFGAASAVVCLIPSRGMDGVDPRRGGRRRAPLPWFGSAARGNVTRARTTGSARDRTAIG